MFRQEVSTRAQSAHLTVTAGTAEEVKVTLKDTHILAGEVGWVEQTLEWSTNAGARYVQPASETHTAWLVHV